MLRNTGFKPKPAAREPRPARDPDEFSSFDIRAATTRAVMVTRLDLVPVSKPAVIQKTPGRVQQSIRDSARGEACRMRLVGCPCDPAMTIWSHCRHGYAGKGGAIKAIDLNGALACTYCDAIYDGQAPRPVGMTVQDVELAWFRAHAESLVILKQKGIL